MKKKLLIFLILIIIIIVGIVVLKNTKNIKDYELVRITEFDYFKYFSNEKCGVIDKNGNKVVDAKYSDIIIPNPQRDVFFCYENNTVDVLNAKGESLYQNFNNVEPIKLKNVASTLNYEKELFKFEKDGMYGLINIDGKQIVKPQYELIENLQLREGNLLVKQNGRFGILNGNGACIIKPAYDGIISDGFYMENNGYRNAGYIVSNRVDDGYRYGYLDNQGKLYLDTEYNSIERIDNDNYKEFYLIASRNGKYGVYKNKKKIIEEEYQSIEYNDSNKLLLIEKNKKYGVADLNGKIIIEPENTSIEFKGIYVYAKKALENIVYDQNGNKINISFNKTIYETESEKYRISTLENDNEIYYGIVDKNGNTLVSEKYQYIEYLFGTYFIAKNENGIYGIISSNGKEVTKQKYDVVQRLKGKKILQAVENSTGIMEIYNSNLQLLYSLKDAIISNEDEYVKIVSTEGIIYLDKDANIINEDSDIINSSNRLKEPEKVGKYKKVQFNLENVYYVEE